MKLKVKISTKAKINEIVGYQEDFLKIKISAIPKKGNANAELINFLSNIMNIPKSHIEIVKGFNTQLKLIEMKGVCKEDLKNKLV